MAEDHIERQYPIGRREGDPIITLNAKKIGAWLTLVGLVVGLIGGVVNYLGSRLASTERVQNVEDAHTHLVESTNDLRTRVAATEQNVLSIREMMEIVAVDICLRRRNEPFASRRLRCSELLDGRTDE